jgi:hypothetical protein
MIKEDMEMDKYVCGICGYVYDPVQGDPENGIAVKVHHRGTEGNAVDFNTNSLFKFT